MSQRWVAILVTVLAVVLLVPLLAASQTATRIDGWAPARTPWGVPDLRGVWDFRTLTALERPRELGEKAVLSAEEAVAYERRTVAELDKDRRTEDGLSLQTDVATAYNQFWWDYGTQLTEDRRTSLIVDPADGRIPVLTPHAKARADAARAARQRPAHGPEDRSVAERCILGFNAGPPVNPSAYNNNIQLFQTPDHVVILTEMVHDARIVPLDGRLPLPAEVRQWKGDSRGRWSGNTLVVETTNFTDKTNFRGSGENLHLVERFTLISADTLLYEYTIDDPDSFTRSWSAALPMKRTDAPLFEYACHEGNYGMFNLLAGARAEERAAEEAALTPSK